MTAPPRAGDLGIVDLHPAPGEQAVCFGSKGLPITEDDALVEMNDGGATARAVLMLAGTTTFGTEVADEFVCDEEHVSQLFPRVLAEGAAWRPSPRCCTSTSSAACRSRPR